MKRLIVGLIIFVLILINVTACSTKQKVETPASSEISQGKRHSGGNMSRDDRPSGEQGTAEKATERLQKRVQDSGVSAGVSFRNGSENAIIGKVKSIVGNEVVLIITNNSMATGKENKREYESTNLSNNDFAEIESSKEDSTETYLIPVGMAIGNKDFSSIKAGNTLKIFFGTDQNDGSKIITAVELR
ncbi:MAG: hypothetical protein VB035_10800 [Candidatus Fimivivens sp.]|nr:hypothetical protein [Candidatus Fimivivens sp.]